MKEIKLFELVTGTEMKPWLSRNMLPNINTCENGWSNFSANLRVVSLKLIELTQFAWPNLSIYFNFVCAVPRDDVIETTRFLMRPLFNHSTISPMELLRSINWQDINRTWLEIMYLVILWFYGNIVIPSDYSFAKHC